uniref:CDGSH iron-sulfur domain-containing protein 2 homologue n=1 Tax=Panagrolaimus sp. ES5 TaxID=591445 RepID=A0AC34GSR2_9BILA
MAGPSFIENLVQFASCSSKSALLDESEMTCDNSNCQNKMMMYGAGLAIAGIGLGYFLGKTYGTKAPRCNRDIKLSTDKVVDTVDIEEIGEKKAFCRCWKSKKFPYCDGSHTAHNRETGDNVGPLIVKKKDL